MSCPRNNTNLVRDKPPAALAGTRAPDWLNRIMCQRSSDDQLLEPIFLLSLSAHRSEVTRLSEAGWVCQTINVGLAM